jgi:hypothetical protein
MFFSILSSLSILFFLIYLIYLIDLIDLIYLIYLSIDLSVYLLIESIYLPIYQSICLSV